jgi:HK97 family phage prohead protease
MSAYAQAAEARRAAIAAPADRPSKRRCAEEPQSRAYVRVPLTGVELRASTSNPDLLHFTGYASVTERSYEMWDFFGPYNEIVSEGAFDATLARADLEVPFVIGHDQIRRMAATWNGTLKLSTDTQGLLVDAPELDPADADVAYMASKIRADLHREMSFAFRIDSGQWSPDYDEFRINAVDMHRGDVSIVGFGANPYTSGGVRAAEHTPKPGASVVTDRDLASRVSLI